MTYTGYENYTLKELQRVVFRSPDPLVHELMKRLVAETLKRNALENA